MVKGIKSRKKLKLERLKKGISRFFRKFNIGEKVVIDIDSSSPDNMPHPRFQGYVGDVIDKRGNTYLVKVKDKFRDKILIITPNHLKKIQR